MEASQLRSMLESVNCESKVTVLPADGLEIYNKHMMPPNRFCTILNTDPEVFPGEHWICIVVLIDGRLVIFDSLASDQHIINPYVKRFADLFPTKSLYKNVGLLQDPFSSSCGLFCIYFFHHLCNEGMDFQSIINEKFTDNLRLNECNVLEFINSRFDNELYKNVQSTCDNVSINKY